MEPGQHTPPVRRTASAFPRRFGTTDRTSRIWRYSSSSLIPSNRGETGYCRRQRGTRLSAAMRTALVALDCTRSRHFSSACSRPASTPPESSDKTAQNAGLTLHIEGRCGQTVPRQVTAGHFRRRNPILVRQRIASANVGLPSCSAAHASISARNSGVSRTPDMGLTPVAGRPLSA